MSLIKTRLGMIAGNLGRMLGLVAGKLGLRFGLVAGKQKTNKNPPQLSLKILLLYRDLCHTKADCNHPYIQEVDTRGQRDT